MLPRGRVPDTPAVSGRQSTPRALVRITVVTKADLGEVVPSRVFPSFYQPTCTASIETEPPSTPSTGNVSGSDGVRVPAT
jgi:hypothetical protein